MTGLTFDTLREANKARLPTYKNSQGEPAHTAADGSDWTPAQWLQAVVGELGEYANMRKKYERGDITAAQFQLAAEKELADVVTYLDILAMRCMDFRGSPHPHGVDLGDATIAKFNEVSDRVGSPILIRGDGASYWGYGAGEYGAPRIHVLATFDTQADLLNAMARHPDAEGRPTGGAVSWSIISEAAALRALEVPDANP